MRLWQRALAAAALALAALPAGAREPGWPPPVHDDPVFWKVLVDQLEVRAAEGPEVLGWDAVAWVGRDTDRLWIKAEGEEALGGEGRGEVEVQLLYGRWIAAFWDLLAGLRHDRTWGPGPDRSRTFGVLALTGLAPYWVEVEPALFVSQHGDLSARLTAETDWNLTRRLTLQPKLELDAALQRVEEFGVGRGLNHLELGLRLRYEVRRELAPYLGLTWSRALGATADLARRDGEEVEAVSLVAGVRFWF